MSEEQLRTLSAFMQISIDGYYCDAKGDMSFAKKPLDDAEWNKSVNRNPNSGGMLLFGRATYEMMAE
jgi:dihydrofolate reductase